MKFLSKIIFFLIFYLNSQSIFAQNKWILDKDLSEISFKLKVLLAEDVKGHFNEFNGYAVIDINEKKNNRALISVNIESVDINYEKYKDLLLSDIFFDINKYPIALIDTKKFSYNISDVDLIIESDLIIKNISQELPLSLTIHPLSKNLIQVKCDIVFSRTSYNIGKNAWISTLILNDKIFLETNLFFYKE